MLSSLPLCSPQYLLTKSPEEIAEWLNSQRQRLDDPLARADGFAALRQQFGQLSHRWHPLLTDRQLHQPPLKALHQLAVRALGVSKLIYQELENQRQGQSLRVPLPVMELLLEFNSLLLDHATAQLELVESTITHADDLQEALVKLARGKTISPAWLVSLARRIILEMRPRPDVSQWVAWPGLRLSDCLINRHWQSESEVYATGIQTARLVAWIGPQFPQTAERLELLTVAALLQDVGFLRLERREKCPPSVLESRDPALARKHPSVGAALASGVGGYAIELSFLIAQHHERLDGTGFPHGLKRPKLTEDAQRLAVAARFQELISQSSQDALTVEAVCFRAGFQLYLESAQGAWDTTATLDLLEALDLNLPEELESAVAAGQPFSAELFLEKRWARHAPEPRVPQPHFLFSRSLPPSFLQTVARDERRVIRRDPKG